MLTIIIWAVCAAILLYQYRNAQAARERAIDESGLNIFFTRNFLRQYIVVALVLFAPVLLVLNFCRTAAVVLTASYLIFKYGRGYKSRLVALKAIMRLLMPLILVVLFVWSIFK
jgi:hypothetical protein